MPGTEAITDCAWTLGAQRLANVEGGVRWAHMVADPDVQIAFSTVKESRRPPMPTPLTAAPTTN